MAMLGAQRKEKNCARIKKNRYSEAQNAGGMIKRALSE